MATVGKVTEYKNLGHLHNMEEYETDEDDYIPEFLSELSDLTLSENSMAHFECKLTPADDEYMKIEWFHNGKPLLTGSRVKTVSDFGVVILEVDKLDIRDSGLYTCKVRNIDGFA